MTVKLRPPKGIQDSHCWWTRPAANLSRVAKHSHVPCRPAGDRARAQAAVIVRASCHSPGLSLPAYSGLPFCGRILHSRAGERSVADPNSPSSAICSLSRDQVRVLLPNPVHNQPCLRALNLINHPMRMSTKIRLRCHSGHLTQTSRCKRPVPYARAIAPSSQPNAARLKLWRTRASLISHQQRASASSTLETQCVAMVRRAIYSPSSMDRACLATRPCVREEDG